MSRVDGPHQPNLSLMEFQSEVGDLNDLDSEGPAIEGGEARNSREIRRPAIPAFPNLPKMSGTAKQRDSPSSCEWRKDRRDAKFLGNRDPSEPQLSRCGAAPEVRCDRAKEKYTLALYHSFYREVASI